MSASQRRTCTCCGTSWRGYPARGSRSWVTAQSGQPWSDTLPEPGLSARCAPRLSPQLRHFCTALHPGAAPMPSTLALQRTVGPFRQPSLISQSSQAAPSSHPQAIPADFLACCSCSRAPLHQAARRTHWSSQPDAPAIECCPHETHTLLSRLRRAWCRARSCCRRTPARMCS